MIYLKVCVYYILLESFDFVFSFLTILYLVFLISLVRYGVLNIVGSVLSELEN